MPKKYRIEMQLVDDETSSSEGSDTHEEWYRDLHKAKEGFARKVKAAKENGRGQGHGNG
jgi:hypothetical protein